MKKIFCLLLIMGCLFLTGCEKKESSDNNETEKITDAVKFKNEYESYNNKKNNNDVAYRNVSIPEKNPFIYASAEDIVKKIENKETFVVYFGFSTCPWCRSVLGTLIEEAKKLELEEIYYVDVYDIRDTYTLDDNNKAQKSKDGSEGYMDLIEILKDVLDDYTLTTSKGKTVKVGEKRIFAPNVVSIVDGEAKGMTSGISSKQTDAYMELTDKMLEETAEKFECVMSCVASSKHVCKQGC